MVLTIAIVYFLLRDDIGSIHNLISRILFTKQNAGSDPSLLSKSSQAFSRHCDHCPLSQVHNVFLEFKEARTTKDHSIQQVHLTDRDDSLCYVYPDLNTSKNFLVQMINANIFYVKDFFISLMLSYLFYFKGVQQNTRVERRNQSVISGQRSINYTKSRGLFSRDINGNRGGEGEQ
jgi:hypothetical protein